MNSHFACQQPQYHNSISKICFNNISVNAHVLHNHVSLAVYTSTLVTKLNCQENCTISIN